VYRELAAEDDRFDLVDRARMTVNEARQLVNDRRDRECAWRWRRGQQKRAEQKKAAATRPEPARKKRRTSRPEPRDGIADQIKSTAVLLYRQVSEWQPDPGRETDRQAARALIELADLVQAMLTDWDVDGEVLPLGEWPPGTNGEEANASGSTIADQSRTL
jgi:hypothetical protein